MSQSKPPLDNPAGDEFRKMEDDGRRFAVLHTGVGPHREGAVVSAKELGPGAELPRLARLGAIRELSSDEVAAHEEALTAPGGEPVSPVVRPTDAGPVVKPAAVPDALKPKNPEPPKA